ncbi:MAG: trypsin-like peptidase domain-containing protein [Lachnospiraceae bacterium]|nr:trypsin-like peptidase domain-containing protein [Lachnospiraceae bacterium]MDD3616534.1 trypsin-like peptidase domain-containing protein [Lachnospiraceae bacterium]
MDEKREDNQGEMKFDPMTGEPIKKPAEAFNQSESNADTVTQSDTSAQPELKSEDTTYHYKKEDLHQEAPKQTYDYYNTKQGSDQYESENGSNNSGNTGNTTGDFKNPGTSNQNSNFQYQSYSQTFQKKPDYQKKPQNHKSSNSSGKKWGILIAMALVFGLVAGGTMFGVNAIADKLAGNSGSAKVESTTESMQEEVPADTVEPKETEDATQASTPNTVSSVESVANTAMPAVVAITNKSVQEVQSWFGGQTQQYESESSGSGIIVGQNDTELLIATNNHVVEGANSLTVAFVDDQAIEAQTKGTDADNDLAVIAVKTEDIPKETLDKIKVVELGDSDALNVGEQVVAIGNALGYGQSVTTGIVSALNREVTVDNTTSSLIQTDAAINPGNSGGALLNMKGQLIGINAIKYAASEVEGMGYAIPIATAEPILDELMNRETRYKVSEDNASYLGITCMNVASETAQAYGMPVGVYITEVTEGGPAQAAGIQKGDIITKLDGSSVSDYEALVNALNYYAAGEKIDVVISRADNGEYVEQTISVTLGNKADMPDTTDESGSSSQEVTPDNGEKNDTDENSGNTQLPNQDIPSINDLLP